MLLILGAIFVIIISVVGLVVIGFVIAGIISYIYDKFFWWI